MIAFDVIGILVDPPAEEGAESEVHAGWHVNTTPEALAAHPVLAAHVVTPSHFRRKWASLPEEPNPAVTIALRFTDEATWQELGLA